MADGHHDFGHATDYRPLVNFKTGEVDRRAFSDQQIYDLELERIFARAWNFMCHESQIPKPGDFFLTYIGDDSVIATRDKKGKLQVLLNTCRHRGNAVCRAEQGHANSFLCTYHGWTYGLDGKLIGVPGFKDFYHEDLDRAQWGLISAAKVASYRGFVFATMDPDAPELDDYLGATGRVGIDLIANRGDLVMVDGIQKNLIGCNWKLAVDNVFDFYHARISHASATQAGNRPTLRMVDGKTEVGADRTQAQADESDNYQRVTFGRYGHAIGGTRTPDYIHDRLEADPTAKTPEIAMDVHWRYKPEAREQFGPVAITTGGHPNIFPNLWISQGTQQLCLRLPRGPNLTELWWFTYMTTSMPEQDRGPWVARANRTFGPAGMLEQEDGENWDQSTRATKSTLAKKYPLHFGMNVGRGQIKHHANTGLSWVDTHVSEHAQLWTYKNWADWLTARDWKELEEIATPVPDTVV